MAKETEYLNGLLGKYEKYQRQTGSDAILDFTLEQIMKEKQRLSPCNKYDEEEVRIALIVKRRI